ncbi:MAG TPA: hypothetical protein ENJ35_08510, partial [Gammaproteobacteria bacterium]|nr:hypothetical protein [Gammaproteobacteria bacterium]
MDNVISIENIIEHKNMVSRAAAGIKLLEQNPGVHFLSTTTSDEAEFYEGISFSGASDYLWGLQGNETVLAPGGGAINREQIEVLRYELDMLLEFGPIPEDCFPMDNPAIEV